MAGSCFIRGECLGLWNQISATHGTKAGITRCCSSDLHGYLKIGANLSAPTALSLQSAYSLCNYRAYPNAEVTSIKGPDPTRGIRVRREIRIRNHQYRAGRLEHRTRSMLRRLHLRRCCRPDRPLRHARTQLDTKNRRQYRTSRSQHPRRTTRIPRSQAVIGLRRGGARTLSQKGQDHSIGLFGSSRMCLKCMEEEVGFAEPDLLDHEAPLPSFCID